MGARVLEFDDILPRLVSTYEQGRLVPFIGSGMSMPACASWTTMAQRLEELANARKSPRSRWTKQVAAEEIVRRANRAVRKLKASGTEAFEIALRASLAGANKLLPPQTQALARLWWPLVLSTNYDSFYAQAFHRRHAPRKLDICGRGSADCQAVLQSLSSPARSILWAMQGFLGSVPKPDSPRRKMLRAQLVVGHDEYRRVTYKEQHFRRAFAEVFRSRSLLFLGSGIRETYLQELFGEVLEIYGASARPHYALMPRGEVDVEFMLGRFQIVVVEYEKHDELPALLGHFANAVQRASLRPIRWGFGTASTARGRTWENTPDLDVCRAPLPAHALPGECLALSAGGAGHEFLVSSGVADLPRAWGVRASDKLRHLTPYLARYSKRHVYLARARDAFDDRGLEHIHRAARDVFEHASKSHTRVRMQLLAAGGTERPGVDEEAWRRRTFPERYSFIQIVRAFADWRRGSKRRLRLSIHLVTPSVYMEIASGRIDVLELLSCEDIRFWAEVVDDGELSERRLFQLRAQKRLSDVVDTLNLPSVGWDAVVVPAPNLLAEQDDDLSVATRRNWTLERLGVVPDTTLRFQRSGVRSEL